MAEQARNQPDAERPEQPPAVPGTGPTDAPSTGPPDTAGQQTFEQLAAQPAPGLLREFLDFLRHNRKWWLLPIILMLLALGVLVVLGGSAPVPWIYPL